MYQLYPIANLKPFGTYGSTYLNASPPSGATNTDPMGRPFLPSMAQVQQTLNNQLNVPPDRWISRASYVNDIGGELVGLAFPEVAAYTRLLSPGYNGLQIVNTARESYKQSGSIKHTLLETSDATLFQGIASIGFPLLISNQARKFFRAKLQKVKKPTWAAPHAGKLAVLLSAGLVAILTQPVNAIVGYLLNHYYRPRLQLDPKQ